MTQIAMLSGTAHVGLISVGAYRPERIVTNEEICRNIEVAFNGGPMHTAVKDDACSPPAFTLASLSDDHVLIGARPGHVVSGA